MHYDPLKCWELLSQQHSVITQNTWISSKTTDNLRSLWKIVEMRSLLPKERQDLIFNVLAASESDKMSYNDAFHLFQV